MASELQANALLVKYDNTHKHKQPNIAVRGACADKWHVTIEYND